MRKLFLILGLILSVGCSIASADSSLISGADGNQVAIITASSATVFTGGGVFHSIMISSGTDFVVAYDTVPLANASASAFSTVWQILPKIISGATEKQYRLSSDGYRCKYGLFILKVNETASLGGANLISVEYSK